MNSSPEGTRALEASGDLPFVMATVAATGRQRMEQASAAGLSQQQALLAGKVAMMEVIHLPVEGPSKILARTDASPPLSFPEFARLRMWLQYSTFDDAARDLVVRLVNAMSQTPALGRLMSHPVFEADATDKGVLLDVLRGACAFGEGRLDEAVARFRSAHEKRPDPLFALAIANCHRVKGERREALAVLEQSLQRWPQDSGLAVLAAGVAFTLDEVEKANRIFAPWTEPYFARYVNDQNIVRRREELAEAIREKRLYRKAEMDIYDDTFA
jgi:tetratricopeptide (TPR) repeat protein